MDDLVGTVTEVRYPEMRAEVVAAVTALADPAYQQRVWVERVLPQPGYYDELALEVHVLFDDIDVCVEPDRWVGVVLRPAEVEPLRTLGSALDVMLADPALDADAAYLADPRWRAVVAAAKVALTALHASGG